MRDVKQRASFKSRLLRAGRALARGGGFATLFAFLTLKEDADPIDCGLRLPLRLAGDDFARGARATSAASGATLDAVVLARTADGARAALDALNKRLAALKGTTYKGTCGKVIDSTVAYGTSLTEPLEQSLEHLAEARKQLDRRIAERTAVRIEKRPTKIGLNRCEDAAELTRKLRGKGFRYAVYWSPPGPATTYVGITRKLKRRCSNYANSKLSDAARRAAEKQRAMQLQTLNLPRLGRQEARNVEEALIAHFGPASEPFSNDRALARQLLNKRHEIDPKNFDYCARLLIGQFLLARNGYSDYASARFTRQRVCPGIGGPR